MHESPERSRRRQAGDARSHVEGIDDATRVLRVVDRPTDDVPREGIHHGATESHSSPSGVFRGVGNPKFVRGEPLERAMSEFVRVRRTAQPFHLHRPGNSGAPRPAQQHGDRSLADPNVHSQGEPRVHSPATMGLPRCRVNLSDRPGHPLPAHLRRQENTVHVLVVAGDADAEKPTADSSLVARLHKGFDYRVNPCQQRRCSPSSFAETFGISTSGSSCRIRFFTIANSMLSGVAIPGRFPRSI